MTVGARNLEHGCRKISADVSNFLAASVCLHDSNLAAEKLLVITPEPSVGPFGLGKVRA